MVVLTRLISMRFLKTSFSDRKNFFLNEANFLVEIFLSGVFLIIEYRIIFHKRFTRGLLEAKQARQHTHLSGR